MGSHYKIGDYIFFESLIAGQILEIALSLSSDTVVLTLKECFLEYEPNLRFFKITEITQNKRVHLITEFDNLPVNTHKILDTLYLRKKPL